MNRRNVIQGAIGIFGIIDSLRAKVVPVNSGSSDVLNYELWPVYNGLYTINLNQFQSWAILRELRKGEILHRLLYARNLDGIWLEAKVSSCGMGGSVIDAHKYDSFKSRNESALVSRCYCGYGREVDLEKSYRCNVYQSIDMDRQELEYIRELILDPMDYNGKHGRDVYSGCKKLEPIVCGAGGNES